MQQRNKLCKRLFLSKSAFCGTLLEINALCYELRTGEKTRLLSNISQNFMTIDNFLEEQQQQCQHATKAFEQIVDKLQALVEKVCKDVTTRARIDADAPISTTMAPGEPTDGKGRAPARHRTKSMSQVKQEHKDRVAAEAKKAMKTKKAMQAMKTVQAGNKFLAQAIEDMKGSTWEYNHDVFRP